MARIIKNGEIVADPWCLLAAGAEALGTVTVIKAQLLPVSYTHLTLPTSDLV